ncbi:MAG: TSUP family transporter, partial [Candidatus Coproplasma sp.]
MLFIIYLCVGFFAGLLGGMGMGGGTILIPALTIITGVNQHVAQATNLIAFLPMAAFSTGVHKRQGLLNTEGSAGIIIPAVITS